MNSELVACAAIGRQGCEPSRYGWGKYQGIVMEFQDLLLCSWRNSPYMNSTT